MESGKTEGSRKKAFIAVNDKAVLNLVCDFLKRDNVDCLGQDVVGHSSSAANGLDIIITDTEQVLSDVRTSDPLVPIVFYSRGRTGRAARKRVRESYGSSRYVKTVYDMHLLPKSIIDALHQRAELTRQFTIVHADAARVNLVVQELLDAREGREGAFGQAQEHGKGIRSSGVYLGDGKAKETPPGPSYYNCGYVVKKITPRGQWTPKHITERRVKLVAETFKNVLAYNRVDAIGPLHYDGYSLLFHPFLQAPTEAFVLSTIRNGLKKESALANGDSGGASDVGVCALSGRAETLDGVAKALFTSELFGGEGSIVHWINHADPVHEETADDVKASYIRHLSGVPTLLTEKGLLKEGVFTQDELRLWDTASRTILGSLAYDSKSIVPYRDLTPRNVLIYMVDRGLRMTRPSLEQMLNTLAPLDPANNSRNVDSKFIGSTITHIDLGYRSMHLVEDFCHKMIAPEIWGHIPWRKWFEQEFRNSFVEKFDGKLDIKYLYTDEMCFVVMGFYRAIVGMAMRTVYAQNASDLLTIEMSEDKNTAMERYEARVDGLNKDITSFIEAGKYLSLCMLNGGFPNGDTVGYKSDERVNTPMDSSTAVNYMRQAEGMQGKDLLIHMAGALYGLVTKIENHVGKLGQA